MSRKRPTIADVQAMKGKRQNTMMRVETLEEAEAADRAGIDMASVPPEVMLDPQFRDAAPGLFAVPGMNFYEIGTADDFIRWAFRLFKASADAVYCSASFDTVRVNNCLCAGGVPQRPPECPPSTDIVDLVGDCEALGPF